MAHRTSSSPRVGLWLSGSSLPSKRPSTQQALDKHQGREPHIWQKPQSQSTGGVWGGGHNPEIILQRWTQYPHSWSMISEGKYCVMPSNHKRFPWNSRSLFTRSNFRQNLGERIPVQIEVGGSRKELNKAPILLSTGAGNRTPLSTVGGGVGNSRCGWVFFTPPVPLHNP